MRLLPGEDTVSIGEVRLLRPDNVADESEDSESDSEAEEEASLPAQKRGRGRPKATSAIKTAAAEKAARRAARAARRASPVPSADFKLTLNGIPTTKSGINSNNQEDGPKWDLEMPKGINIIEMGEEGGMSWKVYVERVF